MTLPLKDERGFAIVPALMTMLCFLLIGVAVLSTVDTQQRESRRERERESSFQLAEGVLSSQIYRLSQAWPGQAPSAFPAKCDATTASQSCPSTPALVDAFDEVDYGSWSNVSWTTHVRDNALPTPNFYSDAMLLNGTPTFDANGDQQIWVRAQARVRPPNGGPADKQHVRTIVALVKAELLPSQFVPNKTLVAGWFETTNNGNKAMVNNGATGEVVVRNCATATDTATPITTSDASCARYDDPKQQVDPERITTQRNFPNGIDHDAGLEALRAMAQTQGNYFTGCPPSLQGDVAGEIVFVEDMGSGCKYTGNAMWNSSAQPGAVVIARGGPLNLGGNGDFFGVIYHANLDNAPGLLVDLRGNTKVVGGVVIDGPGGVAVGSSGGNGPTKPGNLQHNPNAGNPLKVFGTAGIVQNSFREIRATVVD